MTPPSPPAASGTSGDAQRGGAPLRESPLASEHEALGAKMVPFGGWRMPLAYPEGTLAEHLACRGEAVLFDVSHLGTVRVEGRGAFDRLQAELSNDLSRITPGHAQYTHLLDAADASVLDDIIVWWVGPETFDVMPNASNTQRVREALGGNDVTAERAVLALQGPRARTVLAKVLPVLEPLGRFEVAPFTWMGVEATAAGTGYTGEDGVELAVPTGVADELWRALLEAGASPAGLGARDTLRLEAGLPLHGHELGPGITPLQAGLGWVIGWKKPILRARDALERERDEGPRRLLHGIATPGRQPPREGCAVFDGDERVGVLTSGNFSPVLGHGVALALLTAGPPRRGGDALEVDLRGRRVRAEVVDLPFVRRGSPLPKPTGATPGPRDPGALVGG